MLRREDSSKPPVNEFITSERVCRHDEPAGRKCTLVEKNGVAGLRALTGWQRVAGAAVALAALVAGGAAPPASAAPTLASATATLASATATLASATATATGSGPTAQGSVPSPAGPSCLKAAGPFSVHG